MHRMGPFHWDGVCVFSLGQVLCSTVQYPTPFVIDLDQAQGPECTIATSFEQLLYIDTSQRILQNNIVKY